MSFLTHLECAMCGQELEADRRTQGMFVCPEGAGTLAAFQRLRRRGWIADDETAVLLNTGSGHKYAHLWG